jgi:hypothetical protein
MSIAVNFTSALQVVEALNTLGQTTNYNHTELNEQEQNLGSTSDIPCEQVAVLYQVGSATLDLTALSAAIGTYTHTIDASEGGGTTTTLSDRVQFVKFKVPTTDDITARGGSHTQSGNAVTIKFGASNSYDLLGASWQIGLKPGQSALFSLGNESPQVLPTQKNIAISSTGSDEIWCMFVTGGP